MSGFYRKMIEVTLGAILDRFEADPDYGFIDTKLDLVTGENFDDCPAPELAFRRREYIYSWIQGRGLEAMARHLEFLPEYAPRLVPLLKTLTASMERLRSRTGRLWFVTDRDGNPLKVEGFGRLCPLDRIPDAANYSELFYYKGLFAAGRALKDDALCRIAVVGFKRVLDDIAAGRFRTDQQAFDPRNPVAYVPGRSLQGPKMIALGGLALLMNSGEHSCDWAAYAAGFIENVFDRHLLRPGFGFMEAVTTGGEPYMMEGKVLGDPGHAGEFVGLAGKCLRNRDFAASHPELAGRAAKLLPRILDFNFKLGFKPAAGGIVKSVDLLTGEALNSDMPWWNLPETMRAACFMNRADILAKCSDCFRARYVNPNVHMMAYQTLNSAGEPVRVVPATPDADPGYHTNLSMIDVLESGMAG
ncbi:MAG: hypothetical protein PHI85_10230 [Victivallaceae bacterium]|nr:hypothetical protein [Victivallaceae bacterium]